MAGAAGGRKGERNSGATVCPECASPEVRPSRTSYPLDKERNAGGALSFWRCSNCGSRFAGPKVSEEKRRRRAHVHDPLAESLGMSRLTKRWVFPLLVILITAVAVAFILDRRTNPAAPPIITPGPR